MKEEEDNSVLDGDKDKEVEEREYMDMSCMNALFSKKKYFFTSNRRVKNFARGMALFFLILAVVTYLFSKETVQVKFPYSKKRNCFINQNEKNSKFSQTCSLNFQLEQDMKGPVFFLYYIEDIYINHKKYLKSFSKRQLLGQTISEDQAFEECFPIVYNRDLPWNRSWGGYPLDPDAIANPCGLKPLLFFNDTYELTDKNNKKIVINETGIVKQDPGYQPSANSVKDQWINPSNQHFENYMINGALMTKKKLWGVIEDGLSKGQYHLKVKNNYQLNSQGIIKGIQLSTSSLLGVIHKFVPIAFLTASIISLFFSVLVMLRLDNLQEVQIARKKDRRQREYRQSKNR